MNSQLAKVRKQLESFNIDLAAFRSLVEPPESQSEIGMTAVIEASRNRPAVLQGQMAASISILNQLLKDMDESSNREMNMEKRQHYKEDCRELTAQFSTLKQDFDALKRKWTDKVQQAAREELLAMSSTSTRLNQFGSPMAPQNPYASSTPFCHTTASLGQAASAVDDYIGIGLATLGDLQRQRSVMKGTRKKLLDAANSLGLSQSMIRWIEMRSMQDMYIFYGGVIMTLIVLVLVLCYL